MAGLVGGVNSEIINSVSKSLVLDYNFDYFLNSFAKLVLPAGILCYSEPKLLTNNVSIKENKASLSQTFRFVKQHFKFNWVFLMLLNVLIYEKRFALIPFLKSLFYKRRRLESNSFSFIKVLSNRNKFDGNSIDVLIPTIGRKAYLYDVLNDLKLQTIIPKTVLIVEQNPDQNSISELDYLERESWPFKIKHTFTHQTGACNARNIALEQLTSDWVFFADDDIRIKPNFLENCIENVNTYNQEAITLACLREKDVQTIKYPIQWGTFGSGCSFVKTSVVKNLTFKMQFEFGFGEDAEFGMQIRHSGVDIIYFPTPTLLHLKAPIGGFRTKPVLKWDNEKIQPKPSPTILLYKLLYHSKIQINGYKTTLFIRHYKKQAVKNPFKYFKLSKKTWDVSMTWANTLKNNI